VISYRKTEPTFDANMKKLKLTSAIFFVSLLTCLSIPAQTDPNPNSPAPVLLAVSHAGSFDASVSTKKLSGTKRPSAYPTAASRELLLYIGNIELLNNEGASAFRVYLSDAAGRRYIFPVGGLKLIDVPNRIYAASVGLNDMNGIWQRSDNSVTVQMAWRGLVSNSLRIDQDKIPAAITAAELRSIGRKYSRPDYQTTKKPEQNETNYVGYRWSGDRRTGSENPPDRAARLAGRTICRPLSVGKQSPPRVPFKTDQSAGGLQRTDRCRSAGSRSVLFRQSLFDVSGTELVLPGSLLRQRSIASPGRLGAGSDVGHFRCRNPAVQSSDGLL
jgi:hypothetical protein